MSTHLIKSVFANLVLYRKYSAIGLQPTDDRQTDRQTYWHATSHTQTSVANKLHKTRSEDWLQW